MPKHAPTANADARKAKSADANTAKNLKKRNAAKTRVLFRDLTLRQKTTNTSTAAKHAPKLVLTVNADAKKAKSVLVTTVRKDAAEETKAVKAAKTASADAKTARVATAKTVKVAPTVNADAKTAKSALVTTVIKDAAVEIKAAKAAKKAAVITENRRSRRCRDISPKCTIRMYGSIR